MIKVSQIINQVNAELFLTKFYSVEELTNW